MSDGMADRLAQYRAFCLAALQRARDAELEDARVSYTSLAEGWTELADLLEARLRVA